MDFEPKEWAKKIADAVNSTGKGYIVFGVDVEGRARGFVTALRSENGLKIKSQLANKYMTVVRHGMLGKTAIPMIANKVGVKVR